MFVLWVLDELLVFGNNLFLIIVFLKINCMLYVDMLRYLFSGKIWVEMVIWV